MTIAVCYLSPEGFVLGADSTTTYGGSGSPHFFNHAQKVFEIGENSSLAIVTWGLGSLGTLSYRLLIAKLADDLVRQPPSSVREVTDRWIEMFWLEYRNGAIRNDLARVQSLSQLSKHVPGAPKAPTMRTEQEEEEFGDLLSGLVVGFCLGGYVDGDRAPSADVVIFNPLEPKPTPSPIPVQASSGWGAPIMIQRLLRGFDERIREDIRASGNWTGTDEELDAILMRYPLSHPILPIRDAVDFVYTCVYSTIKAFKFSSLSQICGGPIEIAVITSDRRFRWVRHKSWDSAITDGEP